MNMINIGPYLTEAKFKRAGDYERGIVDKVNGANIESIMFSRQLEKIVNHIKSDPKAPSVLTPAIHTGKKKAKASKIWVKNGGASRQDYITDIILAEHKISLKVGKAQLFAGTKNESSALLYSVIEAKEYDNGLAQEISKILDGFVSGALSKVETRKYKTISHAKKEIKELMDADLFNQKVRGVIKKFFIDNPHLKLDVTQEALTGEIKFNNSIASAEYLLAIDKSGKTVKYHSLYDNSYIQKIASQVNPNITFSSTLIGGKYKRKVRTYTTVFRMIFDSLNECFDYGNDNLNENLFIDAFKKFKSFVLEIIEFIKSQLFKGFDYVMDFIEGSLHLEMNTEVDFI